MTTVVLLLVSGFIFAVDVDPAVATDQQALISLFITAIISASVFAAIITGIVQFLINRRNSRITERKNDVDAESSLIGRYKEAAAEERAQKESAVQTVKNLLSIAEEQVNSLKGTVTALTTTIDNLNKMATTQIDIIDALTTERDRSMVALEKAQHQIDEQKEELLRHQREILELTYPKAEVDKMVKDATDKMNEDAASAE